MDRLNLTHKIFALAVVLLFVINQAMLIRIQQNMNELLPELRVKNEVIKQGTGVNAQVIIKLHDNQTVEGYISQISDDCFTVKNPETEQETRIAYNTVEQVKEIEVPGAIRFAGAMIETAETLDVLFEAVFC